MAKVPDLKRALDMVNMLAEKSGDEVRSLCYFKNGNVLNLLDSCVIPTSAMPERSLSILH